MVLHAIYGVTSHIAEVCDRFAADGYAAAAPALYDRSGKDRVFGYDAGGRAAGYAERARLARPGALADIAAAAAALATCGRVAVLGFCTGGSWAWIAAAELDLDAAVIMYGSDVCAHRGLAPRCPTVLHYGDRDSVVPLADVEKIRAAHPDLPCHVYPGADHAFYNPAQPSYDAAAAELAHARSIAFLDRHLAGR